MPELFNKDDDRFTKKGCKWGAHGVLLFINDLTEGYASSCEFRTYYRCACLKCGAMNTLQIDPAMKRKTIRTGEGGLKAIVEYQNVVNRYLELKENSLDDEEITKIITSEYSRKNNKVKSLKR